MKTEFNKTDAYLFLIFFAVAIPITISFEDLSKGYAVPILDTIGYTVATFLATYIAVYKIFPKFIPQQRYISMVMVTLVIFAIIGYCEISLYMYTSGRSLAGDPFFKLVSWCITTTTQNAGVLIGLLLGKKFYETEIKLQKKEKQKRENELMLLKAQIDPHFLFNNLNTVDALIDKDPASAKAYLNHLSKLYRYLIRTKDDEVVELHEELAFAENYMYLIEKRYGTAYQFSINNLNTNEHQLVPPGALQTVLENVVKHNAADNIKPVITKVTITNEDILISNNIQAKINKEESSGTGLANLKARYKLLTERAVKIDISDKYNITLPILNPVD